LPKSKVAKATKDRKPKSTKVFDPLAKRSAPSDMPPEKFRAIGHTLIDSIADFLADLPEAPTASPLLPDAMRARLGKREMPEKGADIAPILEKFSRLFFEHSTHNGSPRFFGYITSSAAPISALADLLAASVNPNCGAWALSPIATEIENESIRWLAQFMGLPGKWDGVLVSGGNMANIVGFFVARRAGHPVAPHLALIATVAVTTVVWIVVTYATRPVDRATLVAFYRLVRPAGPGWRDIRREAGVGPSPDSLPQNLLGWMLGCVFVYAALFGTGSVLYGKTAQAAVWIGLFVVSGVWLARLVPRLWATRPS